MVGALKASAASQAASYTGTEPSIAISSSSLYMRGGQFMHCIGPRSRRPTWGAVIRLQHLRGLPTPSKIARVALC